jgi:adenylate cyclase
LRRSARTAAQVAQLWVSSIAMSTAREWLIAGAPGAATSSPDVLAGTCKRLIDDGVPIARAEAYVRTLHPLVAGRAFEWTPHGGCKAIESVHASDLDTASSPVRNVFRMGVTFRNRLGTGRDSNPYLDELVSIGMTDVIALPFLFTSGEVHAVAFATDREDGFSDADIAVIEAVVPPLTRMAEILALRRSATNVLTAYVGRDAGARVLAGQIRRGDTELIDAAIWFSDMRGFSTLSNQKQPREVIDLLNELFDCQVPAIEEHGGEVLKFIGDGLLAIFAPKPGEDELRACCKRAHAACNEALLRIAERNVDAAEPVRFGIALHVGQVAYGNIGGAARLDFTCIGRAVNLAARLESLTGALGHDVLASEDFARMCEGFEPVGAFEVKGFATPVTAYAPLIT